MKKTFNSASEYYPYYLQEHKNKLNRHLHFIGTFLVILLTLYVLFTQYWGIFWVIPCCGYGFAWVGHFFIEKNKPATFTYPLYSLLCDFRMFYDILRGKL